MMRIELSDQRADAVIKVSEANPGALTVCMHLSDVALDDGDPLKGFSPLIHLDELGIYGPRIWCLYKDVCRGDVRLMIAVLKAAASRSEIPRDKLNFAIDHRGRGLDVSKYAESRSAKVYAIAQYVFYGDDEINLDDPNPPAGSVVVEGIVPRDFWFHQKRLEEKRDEVSMLLTGFHDNFYQTKGGGWSFLQFCVDAKGNQWGEHPTMELLVCLGIGLGLVSYTFPRGMWDALPGGVPYLTIKV